MPPAELVCVECRRRADAQARGWQAHLVESDHDEGEHEVVCFCRFNRCGADCQGGKHSVVKSAPGVFIR